MTTAEMTKDVEALLSLLDAEANALRVADFEKIDALAEEKQRLIETLPEVVMDPSCVETLRQRSDRNGRLFEATLSGLRSVIERLQDVERVSAHLDTYTARGAKRDLGPARSSFEKRS